MTKTRRTIPILTISPMLEMWSRKRNQKRPARDFAEEDLEKD